MCESGECSVPFFSCCSWREKQSVWQKRMWITSKSSNCWLQSAAFFVCPFFYFCMHLLTYLSSGWSGSVRDKERRCPLGGLGLLWRPVSERGEVWWNGQGRTVTPPLRVEGHAELGWFACEWAPSILLVRELSHPMEKVKTSFYQPFPQWNRPGNQ